MDVVAGQAGVSASVARMQAKAAQLAEDIRIARAQASSNQQASTTTTGLLEQRLGSPEPVADVCSDTTASLARGQGCVPPTPAVFRRLSQANTAAAKPTGTVSAETYQAVSLQCQKLEAEVQLWKCKHAEAVNELDRHQDSYMRREEQLKAQLAALMQTPDLEDGIFDEGDRVDDDEHSTSSSTGGVAALKTAKVQKPLTLQEMQQQVLGGLDDLLQRQRLQMRTEEAQQLRQFRSRLAEIEGQLQSYKQAAAAHQGDWMEKTVALREELVRTQEIASKLDAMYKLAEEEAGQLRVQFKAQEDDRQHLIKQLLAAKRENSRLKQEHAAVQDELDAIMALALEAEAMEAPNQSSSSNQQATWAAAAAAAAHRQAGIDGPGGSGGGGSSLAAAINEVVSRRGSSSSAAAGCRSSMRGRPMTAGAGRQQSQSASQPAWPWSAAPAQGPGRPAWATLQDGDTAGAATLTDPAAVSAKMQRYGHVIQKLQKLLESERRQLRQVRSSYNAELCRRSELQSLLLSSIQEAKQQYRVAESAYLAQQGQQQRHDSPPVWVCDRPKSARPASARPGPAAASGSMSSRKAPYSWPVSAATAAAAATSADIQALDQASWEKLLGDLLARQEVLELLFGKAFPDFMAGAEELFQGSHQHTQTGQTIQQQQQPQQEEYEVARPVDAFGDDPDCHVLDDSDSEVSGVCTGIYHADAQPAADVAHDAVRDSSLQQQPATQRHRQGHSTDNTEVCRSSSCSGSGIADAEYASRTGASNGGSSSIMQRARQSGVQGTSRQATCRSHAAPTVIVGSLSGPMMPSFPARQPLHHSTLHRPWSGIVHHQTLPKDSTAGGSRRPASAAVISSTICAPARLGSPGRARPGSAAGSLSFSAQGSQRDTSDATHKQLPHAGTGAAAGGWRAVQGTSRPASAGAAIEAAGPGRPTADEDSWAKSGADLLQTFLSTGK